MNNRFSTLVFCIVALISFNSCQYFQGNSLIGQRMYVFEPKIIKFYGTPVTWDIKELELNFISKEEVSLTLTAIYGRNLKSFDNHSKNSNKYNYTYVNGVLTIPQLDISAVKLTESDSFYTTDDGSIFYKNSIISLSKTDKLERLRKTITTYETDIKKNFLDKEIIMADKD